VTSHAGRSHAVRNLSRVAFQFSIVTGLKPRATCEASYASKHNDWNADGSETPDGRAVVAAPPDTTLNRPCTDAHLPIAWVCKAVPYGAVGCLEDLDTPKDAI